MQGCNLLESGSDLKGSFFPSSSSFFFFSKFSKYATAECELSSVVLARTSQATLPGLLLTLTPPASALGRDRAAAR